MTNFDGRPREPTRWHLWVIGLFVLPVGSASAQTVEVYPSAGASASATTNADYLEPGDERSQIYSTLQVGLGARVQEETAAGFGEYRLLYNQPLATFGTTEDASGEIQTDQTLSVGTEVLLDERLSLELGLSGFYGRNTVRIVQPFTLVDPGVDLVNRTSQQLVTQRNRYVSLGAEGGLRYRLTEVDALSAKGFVQWRRDFKADVDVVGGVDTVEPQPQRDAVTWGTRGIYDHQFTPTLSGSAELGYTRYLVELSPDSTGYNGQLGVRKGLTERLNASGSLGVLALYPDRDDPLLATAGDDARRRVITLQAGASVEALFQNWQASVGYARDATANGPLGNTLLVDAARIDVYWFWDDDILLRGNVVGLLTRPAFSTPEQPDIEDSNQAFSIGASAVFRIVDWLALDLGYSFYRQFPLAEVSDPDNAGNLAARGDISVHTFLVGLSARTTLTPVGPVGPAAAGPR